MKHKSTKLDPNASTLRIVRATSLRAAVGGADRMPKPIPPKDADDIFRPPTTPPNIPSNPPADADDVYTPA